MTDEILDRLSRIADPDLGDDIVSLRLIGDVETTDRTATVPIALGAPYSPAETELLATVRGQICDAGYEPDIVIDVDDRTPAGREGVPTVLAVTAGKGGVGTSTVAANLAAGMARRGAAVGLLDADTRTPTTPSLLGVDGRQAADDGSSVTTAHGVELCHSTAFSGGPGRTGASRAPSDVVAELWTAVDWADRDYVVVDVPARAGESQTAMLEALPVAGTVPVTTPQPVAVDATRAAIDRCRAAGQHVLGAVVNMEQFVCPNCDSVHGGSGTPTLDVALLEGLPLDPSLRESTGPPIVLDEKERATTALLRSLTRGAMDAIGRVRRASHVEHAAAARTADR